MTQRATVDPPPQDLALERATLGGCLYSTAIAQQVAAEDPEIFELDAHAAIHAALRAIVAGLNGHPPDPLLLQRRMEAAGHRVDPLMFAHLSEEGVHVITVDAYLARLRELAEVLGLEVVPTNAAPQQGPEG